MLKEKTLVIIIVSVVFIASIAGAAYMLNGTAGVEEPITIDQKGSDTMYELGTAWAQGIHKENDKITVNVVGGGSSKGIQALLNGTTDIAQASRPMSEEELATALELDLDPRELKVAIDGVAVIVNEDNPLARMTMDQLEALYLGDITDWSELVDGFTGPVHLFGRNNNSGTYAYFKEVVLNKANYSTAMTELAGNPALLNNVASDPLAIGYVGIGYAKDSSGIRILNLTGPDHPPASPLDAEAVISGQYVLSRYLYFYTNGVPEGLMAEYIDWVLDSEGGQKLAEEIGFYALPDEMIREQKMTIGL